MRDLVALFGFIAFVVGFWLWARSRRKGVRRVAELLGPDGLDVFVGGIRLTGEPAADGLAEALGGRNAGQGNAVLGVGRDRLVLAWLGRTPEVFERAEVDGLSVVRWRLEDQLRLCHGRPGLPTGLYFVSAELDRIVLVLGEAGWEVGAGGEE